MNVGSGSNDVPELVTENRRRVAETLGVASDHLMTVHQVHSPDVLRVTEPFSTPRPKADAMVTNVPGIAIGALSADCGPVLLPIMKLASLDRPMRVGVVHLPAFLKTPSTR